MRFHGSRVQADRYWHDAGFQKIVALANIDQVATLRKPKSCIIVRRRTLNMHDHEPIFRMGRTRYAIDNCEPQKEAVREGKIEFHALTKGHYPGTLIPRDVLPGLNSIGFWDANTSQDWGLNPHRNEGIKIVFFETGTCALMMEQKTIHVHAGNFLLTRPWQLHKFGAPNIGRGGSTG